MTASEVDVSLLPLAMKNRCCCFLFFAAALLAALNQPAQVNSGAENTWLDENQVYQAMRQEAFRLLARKIDAVRNGAAEGFDYHIEQAYEKIKNRLPSDQLSASELESWLRQFLPDPAASAGEKEFQTLIENFIRGMSLEISTTLQYECEQAEDLIALVAKLEKEIKKVSRPGRDTLDLALRQAGASKKMAGIIKNIDRNWRIPPAGTDDFSVFSVLKKNMTGQSADKDQRLVFDLGARYQFSCPFLDGFMENYRRLAGAFRWAVQELNASLGNGGNHGGGERYNRLYPSKAAKSPARL
jgi:hypothetical protein